MVVTYFPDEEQVSARLRTIQRQVDAVVVVDNGSPAELPDALQISAMRKVTWLPLGENLGIARAQNLGIEEARAQGADYVVLFDQDSDPAPNMVKHLVKVGRELESKSIPVALLAPNYLDERQAERIPFVRFRDGRAEWFGCDKSDQVVEIDTAISSGSVIPVSAIDAVGGMRVDFFIDLVDIEWCLRARSLGYRAFGVCDAILRHSLGESPKEILGRRLSIHSPLRNYYFYRNAIWLFKQSYVPLAWKRAVGRQMLKRYIVFSLAVAPRLEFFKLMTLGLWHGLRGRSGRLDIAEH